MMETVQQSWSRDRGSAGECFMTNHSITLHCLNNKRNSTRHIHKFYSHYDKKVSQPKAKRKLLVLANKIFKWRRNWKIQLNSLKTFHVNFALLRKESNLYISLEGCQISQAESIKYFERHHNDKLNWTYHVGQKASCADQTQNQTNVLVNWNKLSTRLGILIHLSIIKKICTYGV